MQQIPCWFLVPVLLFSLDGCSGSGSSGADAGQDAESDAGSDADGGGDTGPAIEPGHPGASCWNDDDCLFDGACLTTSEGFPGGYCIVWGCDADSCPAGSTCYQFTSGDSGCLPSCSESSQCRQEHGYVCDADDTCWPGEGTVPPGGPCAYDNQCQGGAGAVCIKQMGLLDGYCVIQGCDPSCPAGSECREALGDGAFGCVPLCQTDDDCRTGYACLDDPGQAFDRVCVPGCQADDCPHPLSCVQTDEWSGHMCADMTYICSPENPGGDCEPDHVCSEDGVCQPFVCDDTVLEPNQDDQQARPLPIEDTPGMQICEDDEDWFTFVPGQDNTLYHIGMDYNLASGDLEIELLDDQLTRIDSAHVDQDDILPGNSLAPLNRESLALIGVPGSSPYYVRVFGRYGAVNNYTLLSRVIDYRDGPVCTDLYSTGDCRAQAADGNCDPSLLIPFPSGHPDDSFIGGGISFDHGLTGDDNTSLLPASIRYARRELIMLVRNAVHEVQLAFPGTAPLGVGDVGLSDGHTPNGHPATAHDDGRNVDIAYYVLPEYQGRWGNAVYRQICCDALFLFDWACVELDQDDPAYGTCVAGSENTHIVDIPRTALLLAKLATGNRMRVVGVETKIRPDLELGLDQLFRDGLITQVEYDAVMERMQTTEDDPSWLWHFHHMHLSLCEGDCDE